MIRPVSYYRKKRYIIKTPAYKKPHYLKYINAIVLVAVSIIYLAMKAPLSATGASAGNELYYVERVVDGDTLKLSNGQKVRLIGIDTPEVYFSNKLKRDARRSRKDILTIQAMGRRASDFTKKLCSGKKVRLETDVEKRDKYGRLLAYVYLEDGVFVNARILEEGYAQVMTISPNVKYADYFAKLQKKAREEGKGLWATSE